jgi:cobalt-zinc-cadmium efflux system membrane fusion protein
MRIPSLVALVAATLVQPDPIHAAEPLGCLIEPEATSAVGSPIVGVVSEVLVERGDRVEAGQIIARLESSVQAAAVASARSKARSAAEVGAAQANLEFARSREARASDLSGRQMIAQEMLDEARTQARLAAQRLAQATTERQIWREELALAEARLAQHEIRAPIAGVVVDRLVEVGERVEEQPLARIVATDPLRVELVMPASAYRDVQPGAAVEVTPELPGTEGLTARVTRIDPVVDAASNTFRVRLQLPNPDSALPAGLRCQARLTPAPGATVGTGEVAVAPAAAVPASSASAPLAALDPARALP